MTITRAWAAAAPSAAARPVARPVARSSVIAFRACGRLSTMVATLASTSGPNVVRTGGPAAGVIGCFLVFKTHLSKRRGADRMDLGHRDARVVVTGGGANIGRGIALGFAAEGARVLVADIDGPQAEAGAAGALTAGG